MYRRFSHHNPAARAVGTVDKKDEGQPSPPQGYGYARFFRSNSSPSLPERPLLTSAVAPSPSPRISSSQSSPSLPAALPPTIPSTLLSRPPVGRITEMNTVLLSLQLTVSGAGPPLSPWNTRPLLTFRSRHAPHINSMKYYYPHGQIRPELIMARAFCVSRNSVIARGSRSRIGCQHPVSSWLRLLLMLRVSTRDLPSQVCAPTTTP